MTFKVHLIHLWISHEEKLCQQLVLCKQVAMQGEATPIRQNTGEKLLSSRASEYLCKPSTLLCPFEREEVIWQAQICCGVEVGLSQEWGVALFLRENYLRGQMCPVRGPCSGAGWRLQDRRAGPEDWSAGRWPSSQGMLPLLREEDASFTSHGRQIRATHSTVRDKDFSTRGQ